MPFFFFKLTYPVYRFFKTVLWSTIHLKMSQSFGCLYAQIKGANGFINNENVEFLQLAMMFSGKKSICFAKQRTSIVVVHCDLPDNRETTQYRLRTEWEFSPNIITTKGFIVYHLNYPAFYFPRYTHEVGNNYAVPYEQMIWHVHTKGACVSRGSSAEAHRRYTAWRIAASFCTIIRSCILYPYNFYKV